MKDSDKTILDKVDEIYTECPFYGARRISKELYRRYRLKAGRKKVGRMMKTLGIEAICLKKKLSRPNKEHAKYPYLLKGLDINHRNMVWSADITYIRLSRGYAYLVAIIDWYSRYVLSWRLSYSMDTSFCISALNEALDTYGTPEYFNTDQGSQFTDKTFVGILEEKKTIKISMDGKGRALDNVFVERLWRSVKYEDVYLRKYETMFECEAGLKKYFGFYNNDRIHQSLGYKIPADVYFPKSRKTRKAA